MTTLQQIHTLAKLCPYQFPPPMDADGLVGIGGDLHTPTLLYAYLQGLFPWFDKGDAIAWWCPNPRCVITPSAFIPQKSLVRTAKKRRDWQIYLNRDFDAVIHACSLPRSYSADTWIHDEIKQSYSRLHQLGVAFSVEIYDTNDQLAGGLYGLKIGACVFGESMFHHQTDASKLAFWALCYLCVQTNILLIDCQLPNTYLLGLGAQCIPRTQFLQQLHTLTHPQSSPANQATNWSSLAFHQPLSWLL